jgi:orotate phosphoribosyltransferase
VDETQLWALLERGGGVRRGHFAGLAGHSEVMLDKYSGLLDPLGAEALGKMLAERLRDVGANTVVVWDNVEDLVLGFVVARELETKLVRVYNDGGLLGCSPDIYRGDRAILVSDRTPDPGTRRAARALLEKHKGSLLGTGVLMETGESEASSLASLARFSSRLHSPAGCPLCRQGMPIEGPIAIQGPEGVNA